MERLVARKIKEDPTIAVCRTLDKVSRIGIKKPRAPYMVRRWEDFNLRTLLSMDGGILAPLLQNPSNSYDCTTHGGHGSGHFDAPADEHVLGLTLSKCLRPALNCALVHTQQYLRGHGRFTDIRQPGIRMLPSGQAEKVFGEGRNELKPDWAGCLPIDPGAATVACQPPRPQYRLPGLLKLRSKVDFRYLDDFLGSKNHLQFQEFGRVKAKTAKMIRKQMVKKDASYAAKYLSLRHALMQIYTYCCYTGCRYGYIITESQLLVVRIQPWYKDCQIGAQNGDILDDLKEHGLLEYRLIEYNPTNSNSINVTQSLWWLHILAATDHEIKRKYIPLRQMTLKTGNIVPHLENQESFQGVQQTSGHRSVETQRDGKRDVVRKRKCSSMQHDGQEDAPQRATKAAKLSANHDLATGKGKNKQLKPRSEPKDGKGDTLPASKPRDTRIAKVLPDPGPGRHKGDLGHKPSLQASSSKKAPVGNGTIKPQVSRSSRLSKPSDYIKSKSESKTENESVSKNNAPFPPKPVAENTKQRRLPFPSTKAKADSTNDDKSAGAGNTMTPRSSVPQRQTSSKLEKLLASIH